MRGYTVEFENVSVTTANADYDHFEGSPTDERGVKVTVIVLDVLSELGDAQEEHLRLRLIRGHATSGSGGSTATPRPHDALDSAAGISSWEINNSTIASTGTTVNLLSDGFNVRGGYRQEWDALGFAPLGSQTDVTILLRQLNTVTDDVSMSGTLSYVEPG
jgi:hypothetical protein